METWRISSSSFPSPHLNLFPPKCSSDLSHLSHLHTHHSLIFPGLQSHVLFFTQILPMLRKPRSNLPASSNSPSSPSQDWSWLSQRSYSMCHLLSDYLHFTTQSRRALAGAILHTSQKRVSSLSFVTRHALPNT